MLRSAVALTLALYACGASEPHGLPTVRVVVTLGSHRATYLAEVAADPASRAQGLMFRKKVPAGTGMLFLFPQRVRASFYMKDTLVPLDIAWIRAGRLVEIAHMQPCETSPCPLWTPAEDYDSALETNVGGLAGAGAGAKVDVFGEVPAAR